MIVTCDAFINGQQEQVEAILVALVQQRQQVS